MNAIEKFAKEHGAEYEDEKTLAPLFKKAVQSVIGKKGKVRQAWTYTGSNEYGYVDWEASVVGVDGMMPEDEIVIVLTTDLDDGNSWICGRYMDENDTIAEVDDTPTDDPFDAVSVIDKLMSEVREERSSKGESKKNEKGTTKIETYDGFDELLGYADAEYLLEDVVDVLSQYYTYEDETFDEDQAKDDPEFTIKIEGGDERADFYSEDIFYVHLPNKEAAKELAKVLGGELSESKKPESKKSEDFRNYTLKQLRFQLKNGWAKDLTNASDEEIQAIIDSGHEISGVSNGTYGMNGLKVTYRNPDGSIGSGVVIGRTPNLFALLSPQKPKKTGDAPKPSESKKKEAAGDSPQKIYRIKSLSTDVYEDDWEDGEGEHVNSWSGSDVLGRKMYKEFSSLGDILRMLNDEYLYIWKDADNIKNWAIFDDPDLKDEIRFDCDTLVDVDNSPADESDIESWKKGDKKLFNAHSVLYVTAEYTTYESAAELTEDAKKIGLDTI